MPDERIDPEQAEVVFALAVLTALADNTTDDAEARAIGEMRRHHPVFANLSNVREVSNLARDRKNAIGIDAAVREFAAKLHQPYYKEEAYRLCARVMGADQATDLEEMVILGELQRLFGLTPATARTLLRG